MSGDIKKGEEYEEEDIKENSDIVTQRYVMLG